MRYKRQLYYLKLLLILISVNSTIQAQNPHSGEPSRWKVPNSPMGKQISVFMDALDSKELSQIQEYVTANYAPDVINKFGVDKLANQLKQYADEFDDLQIIELRRSDEKSVIITVLSKKNRVEKSFVLTISDVSSHKIAQISVKVEETLPFTDFKKLDKYLKKQTKKGDFSGAVLVSVKGKTKFEKAYGLASKRFNIPNNTKTKFNIGSLNKLFTATAILQLYEQGLLKLDDPLSKYSSQFPQEIADKVTIRHLLKHQSGWSSYWGNEYFKAHFTELRTIDDYISFLKDVPLEFEPGSQQRYSNTGYVILGTIIENITGESYFDYVRVNIYNKSGMKDTDSYEMDIPIPNLAIGYMIMEGSIKRKNNLFSHTVKGVSAGGGYSTLKDLQKYYKALSKYKLLNKKGTNMLLNGYDDNAEMSNKLGYAVAYGGGGPGINAVLGMDFGSDILVVVLSNYGPPTAGKLGRQIMRMLNE